MLSKDVVCLLEGVRVLLSFITCLPSFTLILWFPPCPRCVGVLQTAVQRVGVFLLIIFILIILALVAVGSCAQHFDFLALLMLQPYCSVHYGTLPPIWPEHLKPFVNMKFTQRNIDLSLGQQMFYLKIFVLIFIFVIYTKWVCIKIMLLLYLELGIS